MKSQDSARFQQDYMARELEGLQARMEGSSAKLEQFEKELGLINPEDKTNILSQRLIRAQHRVDECADAADQKQAAADRSVRTHRIG